MMTMWQSTKWIGCGLAVVLLTVPQVSGQSAGAVPAGFIGLQADEVFANAKGNQAVILGDPSKAGWYVVRIRFAPGTGSRPHVHDQDRYVTVIKGTWWVSLGPESDTYAPEKMTAMKAGSFILHPANGHHYDGAKDEEAIVQIMGMGPVKTTQLEASTGRGRD